MIKVGNKVRVNNDGNFSYPNLHTGLIGEILVIYTHTDPVMYEVEFKEEGKYPMFINEFQLVERKKLKVI